MDDYASVITKMYAAISKQHYIEAGDLLMDCFDQLFSTEQFTVAKTLLENLDPERLPPTIITAILCVTKHASTKTKEFLVAREDFVNRSKMVLKEQWGLDTKRIEQIYQRLE